MHDELDAFLSAGLNGSPVDEAIAPLLEANDRLSPLSHAEPSPHFARDLEARLLAHADQLAGASSERTELFTSQAIRDLPGLRSIPRSQRRRHLTFTAREGSREIRRGLTAVAAVLVLSVGFFVLITGSRPGSPLYGFFHQNTPTSTVTTATARAHALLRQASQALDSLDQVLAQHGGDRAYLNTLAALRSALGSAATQIAALPAGADQTSLMIQLRALQAQARHDLRAALPQLSWPARIDTTLALGELGDTVPAISHAVLTRVNNRMWQVTITGVNFASGAILLVADQPSGTVTRLSATKMVARIATGLNQTPSLIVGVGNPDDTAARATATLAPPDE